MSNAARLTILQSRLTDVQTAITATIQRNVSSYSDEIQTLAAMPLSELRKLERDTVNEISRLQRGSRFGTIGFKGVAG